MAEKNRTTSTDYIKPDIIHYSNCWEDARVLLKALQVKEGGVYLSIASSGDNTLSLLTHNPSAVFAVDASPAQIACLEIRKVLIVHLAYEEVLQFLGINDGIDRITTYNSVRSLLSSESRAFWDEHSEFIHKGIIHIGKFENYFRIFRQWVLPLILNKERLRELLRKKSESERVAFYDKKMDTWRWRLLFRIFFSRIVMGHLGREPEFFKYVEGNVAERIMQRTKYALTTLPIHNNPYLEYIVMGNFINTLPHYLLKENYVKIRKNLDKLILFRGYLSDALSSTIRYKYDGFNLSDIFEYMNYDQYIAELENVISTSKKSARLVYWNMLVTRKAPESLSNRLRFLEKHASDLLLQDRAFFYKSLIIEEVQ